MENKFWITIRFLLENLIPLVIANFYSVVSRFFSVFNYTANEDIVLLMDIFIYLCAVKILIFLLVSIFYSRKMRIEIKILNFREKNNSINVGFSDYSKMVFDISIVGRKKRLPKNSLIVAFPTEITVQIKANDVIIPVKKNTYQICIDKLINSDENINLHREDFFDLIVDYDEVNNTIDDTVRCNLKQSMFEVLFSIYYKCEGIKITYNGS